MIFIILKKGEKIFFFLRNFAKKLKAYKNLLDIATVEGVDCISTTCMANH